MNPIQFPSKITFVPNELYGLDQFFLSFQKPKKSSTQPEKLQVVDTPTTSELKEPVTVQHVDVQKLLSGPINLNDATTQELEAINKVLSSRWNFFEKKKVAANCLKHPLDLSKSSKEVWFTVLFLEQIVSEKMLLALVPAELSISNMNEYSIRIFKVLWEHHQLRQVIIARLSPNIDLSSIDDKGERILEKIIEDGFSADALRRLGQGINLENTSDYWYQVVIKLIRSGHQEHIARMLPKNIDISTLSLGGVWVLVELFKYEHLRRSIVDSLVHIDSLADLGQNGTTLVKHLMMRETPVFIEELLSRSPRQELKIEQVPDGLGDGYLAKQLSVIKKNSNFVYIKGNWSKYYLVKDGSTTHIFLNEREQKVVFRITEMLPDELANKQRALSLMGDYVVGSSYSELQTMEGSREFTGNERQYLGREIFGGIAIGMLDLDLFPAEVKRSILEQKNYLILKMQQYGIRHDHPHDLNINVRFLIVNQNGERTVVFEPKEAFRLAAQVGSTITPIVAIRDWDYDRLQSRKL